MNPWWWVLIGLTAWFLVAIGVGMLIGPVLRRSSQARESLDQTLLDSGLLDSGLKETSGKREPPQDERQAS